MPSLRQNRCMAERLAEMPWVLSRWSASSAWVQLARSSPCLAGPSMTQRRISSASSAGIFGASALGLAGPEAVEAAVEVGVEPALDGAGRDAEVGGDVLVRAAPVGQPDDLEAVAELAVGGLAEGLFEASASASGRWMRITVGWSLWVESMYLLSIRTGQHHRACVWPIQVSRLRGRIAIVSSAALNVFQMTPPSHPRAILPAAEAHRHPPGGGAARSR